MSEFDADLKQLFAQSREDFDGVAFRADVEHKIARARKVGYAIDALFVVLMGCAAFVGVPVVMDMFGTTASDLVDTGVTFSATPIGAWATAAAASAVALVWVRA